MELDDIVEIAEGRRMKANLYLEHGYRLLFIQGTSEEDKGLTGNPFIRQGIKYVLGRPETVDHYDPPEWKPPEEVYPPENPPQTVRKGLHMPGAPTDSPC